MKCLDCGCIHNNGKNKCNLEKIYITQYANCAYQKDNYKKFPLWLKRFGNKTDNEIISFVGGKK